MAVRLSREFYDVDTVELARKLLGKVIAVSRGGVVKRCRIVETEAYLRNDPASHSYKGITKRNKSMFGEPGTLYVYTIHRQFCMNIVRGYGEAVLIRAAEPLNNITEQTKGPGRLCRALGVSIKDDGKDLTSDESDIWIEDDGYSGFDVVRAKRVGVSKAKNKLLRFYIKDSKWVSKK